MSISESTSIPINETLGRGSDASPPGYDPSPGEEKAIKLAQKCFDKAKAARKPYEQKWLDYYRMFRGQQWRDARPSYRHSEVINLVFRAIQSEIPILTDSRPRPEFIPQEPSDLAVAQILNDVLESDWNEGCWLHSLTEAIYDAHFYGAGFAECGYDPEAAFGAGRITFGSTDPFDVYPDPSAYDVNLRANYFVIAEPTPVDKLKAQYPDKAEYIKPDLVDMSRRDRTNFNEQMRYKSPTDNRTVVQGGGYDLDAKDEALKITLYIHDPEYIEEEVEETDPTSGMPSKAYIQKLKYPNGRKICICGGVLLDDGPLPFDDKKFPFVRLLNYILPREFWGISEVEQLESPQKTFNKLVSFALDVLTLMGNPIWVVDADSGIDVENLFNRPGLVVEKNKGTEARREEGVQLQPFVMQLIDKMKLWFDDISGSNDVSRGVRPEGVTAAAAITALQDAQQTRIRQKSRNIDTFMQQFGQMYISRVFQFYDAPRIFRVTNDENVTNYFKFHIDKAPVTDEEGNVIGEQTLARVRPYEKSLTGDYKEGEEKVYQIKGEFDVRINSGSSLPFEKTRVENQSYQLFDRGIIDAEEVLKNIKYPNAEAVLQRMADKQAQAEAAQAGQGAPAPQA